jgi:hypothetical protein
VPFWQVEPDAQTTPTHEASTHAPFEHTSLVRQFFPMQFLSRQTPPTQAWVEGHSTPTHAASTQASATQTCPAAHVVWVQTMAWHCPPAQRIDIAHAWSQLPQ